jgi:hypothetical protein
LVATTPSSYNNYASYYINSSNEFTLPSDAHPYQGCDVTYEFIEYLYSKVFTAVDLVKYIAVCGAIFCCFIPVGVVFKVCWQCRTSSSIFLSPQGNFWLRVFHFIATVYIMIYASSLIAEINNFKLISFTNCPSIFSEIYSMLTNDLKNELIVDDVIAILEMLYIPAAVLVLPGIIGGLGVF